MFHSHKHSGNHSNLNGPINPALELAFRGLLSRTHPNAQAFLELTLDAPKNSDPEVAEKALEHLAKCAPPEIDHLFERVKMNLAGGDNRLDYLLLSDVGLALIPKLNEAQQIELAKVARDELDASCPSGNPQDEIKSFFARAWVEARLRHDSGDRSKGQELWRNHLFDRNECLVLLLGNLLARVGSPAMRSSAADMLAQSADIHDEQLQRAIIESLAAFASKLHPFEQSALLHKLKPFVDPASSPWSEIQPVQPRADEAHSGRGSLNGHPAERRPGILPQFTIPDAGLKQILRGLKSHSSRDRAADHELLQSMLAPFLRDARFQVRDLAFRRLGEYCALLDCEAGLAVSRHFNLVVEGKGTSLRIEPKAERAYPFEALPEILSFLGAQAKSSYSSPCVCAIYLSEILKLVAHEYRKYILPSAVQNRSNSIDGAAALLNEAVSKMAGASPANSLLETFMELIENGQLSQFGEAADTMRLSFQLWLPYSAGLELDSRLKSLLQRIPELGVCSQQMSPKEQRSVRAALERLKTR